MKRVAVLLPDNMIVVGARYKYIQLLKQICSLGIFFHREFKRSIRFRPEYFIVFGSFWESFKYPMRNHLPYVLCDHDISSLYHNNSENVIEYEKVKIKNAFKIIFTSPEHQQYICDTHKYQKNKTMVLYLRTPKKDLRFEYLPKLEGKNLVYIGGLLSDKFKDKKFAYRCYIDLFKEFMDRGWNVHLYPVRRSPVEYIDIGCIMHSRLNEGLSLFKECSQYQAGLQIFNVDGVPDKSLKYSQMCRPNKLWNYLASGIPTIGYNGGNGMSIYDGKWGIVINNPNEIDVIEEKFKTLDIEKYRNVEVMETQKEELRSFLNL